MIILCSRYEMSLKFWSENALNRRHTRTKGLESDYFAASEGPRKEDLMSCANPLYSAIVLYHSCDSVLK